VKPFILLKLSTLLLGIVAALFLTPACKAQSEVSPDHFDGTDSWAMAARPTPAQPQKQPASKPSLQAQSHGKTDSSSFQLVADREASKPVSRAAVAIDRKRKTAAPNTEKP